MNTVRDQLWHTMLDAERLLRYYSVLGSRKQFFGLFGRSRDALTAERIAIQLQDVCVAIRQAWYAQAGKETVDLLERWLFSATTGDIELDEKLNVQCQKDANKVVAIEFLEEERNGE